MQYILLRQARPFFALVSMLGVLLGTPLTASADTLASVDLEGDLEAHLFINDSDQTGLDVRGDLTLEAWVKLLSAPPVGESYAVVSKSAGDINDGGFDFVYQTGSQGGQFTLAISPNGSWATYCTVSHTLLLGEWHHVAAVYRSSAGECEIFVDGLSIGSMEGLATSIHNSGAPLRIGARGHTPMFFFDGLIDDVRVWNTARSVEEIAAFFYNEISGAEEHLVGYWQLNGDLLDVSVQGNHLSASGDVVFSSDTPFLNESEDDSTAWAVRECDRAAVDVATPASPTRPRDGVERASPAEPAEPVRLPRE